MFDRSMQCLLQADQSGQVFPRCIRPKDAPPPRQPARNRDPASPLLFQVTATVEKKDGQWTLEVKVAKSTEWSLGPDDCVGKRWKQVFAK